MTEHAIHGTDHGFDHASFYLDAMTDAENALKACWAKISTEKAANAPDCQTKVWSLEMKMRDQETLRAYWWKKLANLGFRAKVRCEWYENMNLLAEY